MRERRTLGLAPALPGIALVVVIVWALAAVLMLTSTLLNAREIDDTVPLIVNQVSPIDEDTDNIELAAETADITERILAAAEPLDEQADRIIAEAENIDARAASILGTATDINETARAINGNATSINETVGAITGNVVSINDTVDSIGGNVASINGTVDAIGTKVSSINGRVTSIFDAVGSQSATSGGSIKASVGDILGDFRALEPVTRAINGEGRVGVEGINGRADTGIERVEAIKSDFVPIRVLVGSADPAVAHDTAGPGNIHGHANSIDCSPLLNLIPPGTRYCNR